VIFVTVGTQLAFDRLIEHMDEWAKQSGEEVIAQIGPSKLKLSHIRAQPFMSPLEIEELFGRARVIVAHAGMGSIISALQHQRPIIIVPRKASLGEHRNDHQLATARWMSTRPGVSVAWEPSEITQLIADSAVSASSSAISPYADPKLVARLRDYMSL
jgi:UDP-N-acetylglucosamine transferase subunit ALG13